MTTQLISARAVREHKGLQKEKRYLFSLQVSDDGIIRIVTNDDIEVYYSGMHDFLISWGDINSLGWANDKETFVKILAELKGDK